MVSLFIHSTAKCSGKSLLAVGMGLRFKQDGYRVGYMKPVGWVPVQVEGGAVDQDALLAKGVLGLKDPLELMSPAVMTQEMIQLAYEGQVQGLHDKIVKSFQMVSRDKEIVLLEGVGSFFEGGFIGVRGIELGATLEAKILLNDTYQDGVATIESLLDSRELLGDRLIGAVINRVTPDKIGFVRRKVLPFLERQEIRVWAVIPEDRILRAISVRYLAEIVSGSVICREDKLDEMTEGFMVGAMSPENALRYFHRERDIVVITGGDRPDIQLAALETSVKGIILTGGFFPHDIILSRAEEKGIPLIIVDQDTFSVVGRLERAVGRLGPGDTKKVERARELLQQELDFAALYRKMGLLS